jgi:hypothetical protein
MPISGFIEKKQHFNLMISKNISHCFKSEEFANSGKYMEKYLNWQPFLWFLKVLSHHSFFQAIIFPSLSLRK